MREETVSNPKLGEQFSDVLLVSDTNKKEIRAVNGIGKDKELQTVVPDKKNESQFLRVDKQGDLFSNFFSNFYRQLKDPTHFIFFRVPENQAIHIAERMQKEVDNPTKMGGKQFEHHQIKLDYKPENKNNMETKQSMPVVGEYRYKLEQID